VLECRDLVLVAHLRTLAAAVTAHHEDDEQPNDEQHGAGRCDGEQRNVRRAGIIGCSAELLAVWRGRVAAIDRSGHENHR